MYIVTCLCYVNSFVSSSSDRNWHIELNYCTKRTKKRNACYRSHVDDPSKLQGTKNDASGIDQVNNSTFGAKLLVRNCQLTDSFVSPLWSSPLLTATFFNSKWKFCQRDNWTVFFTWWYLTKCELSSFHWKC